MFRQNPNELAYPFLYDAANSLTCDYEILSDELSSLAGAVLSRLEGDTPLRGELIGVVGLIYHMNGSLRGQCAVREEDAEHLSRLCDGYAHYAVVCGSKFVLPLGHPAACLAHIARTRAKALVRLLFREHERCPRDADALLIRLGNLLSNYFFLLALKINAEHGIAEIPFQTQSYK